MVRVGVRVQEARMNRDQKSGQFVHDEDFDRMCTCGHTLGIHTAASVGGERPCMHGTFKEHAPSALCGCRKFKLKRVARKGLVV